ncbi:hypothetical protein ANAPRD1_00154 [Anaplasma phagocytophilum]|uniref:hypothetical protein n=1 Tax=Anaplasma phagocytophilum TaxID=948 RepID=UPI0007E25B93|nr:hypothetical protein [Anaplasma phagocytophilum]SCV62161.1 hypothetical protein ANAPRD1_00154 [Anaplasma phagocytophilum]
MTKDGHTDKNSYGVYSLITAADKNTGSSTAAGHTSLCGDKGGSQASKGGSSPQTLKDFVEVTLKEKEGKIENWPTSTKTKGSGTEKSDKTNDNANAVATDLVNLNRDEKIKVAGLLAKTIEGGEVVEIRAVSSTSLRT